MNIVYCIPSLHGAGGMERVLTRKVNYLAATGKYTITIVTVEQGGKSVFFPLDESVKRVDLNVDFKSHYNRNLLVKTYLHYKKLKLYKKKLEAYLKQYPADICISLCGKEIDFLGSLTDGSVKMAEVHFAKDFRKQFLLSTHKGKVWEWIGSYRVRSFVDRVKRLDYLVVLTKADRLDWLKDFAEVSYIYNPTEQMADGLPEQPERKFIAVGRLEPQKGFEYLINSWYFVVGQHPDWVLHIWGEGFCRKRLEELISRKNLKKHVLLKGTTRDIRKEYLNSYAYVMSSRYEGFPMVLLEASACGLPLVSFDCRYGPGEIIQNGLNGFLVPAGDFNKLAKYMCYLIENRVVRDRMAKTSLEMSKRYDIDLIMNQWMDLFDSLVARNRK
ncbi:glycosyltransferase family 4 protein [Parabacteroides bouchesdurhonensis]|uniref:glycosyltransferase family 4 protein n=1 Tax=Parabacteroides bouchesdurhonensis TaxID=1936995 RepID=UPI000E4FBDCC|nr:glycosyltransferase family 4 protein [Parabacteroides bouchesdurhonensis]RHJ94912.1 glycosyltransferase family 4 protein [Bacteroides sp. AM07-16]